MPVDANGSYSAEQAEAYKAKNRDFPLRWHPRGGWCKRIRGRTYYWGRVPPDEALQRYHHEQDYLHKGELPPPYDPERVTVRDLANEFLAAKKTLVASGELARTTWDEYKRTCGHMVKHFGAARAVENLTPDDLLGLRSALTKGRNLVALRNEINRARIVFKFAYESGLIERPMRYGQGFKRPAAGAIRRARYAAGEAGDEPAVNLMMGHVDDSMGGLLYRLEISGRGLDGTHAAA